MTNEKESSLKFYRLAGIRVYKKHVPFTGDIALAHVKKDTGKNQVYRSEQSLTEMIDRINIVEKGHMILFLIGCIENLYLYLTDNNLNLAVIILGINTLTNYYPFLLQRYNKIRLHGAVSRLKHHNNVFI